MAGLPSVTNQLSGLRVRLGEIGRAGRRFAFEPDDTARADMAKTLGLVSLPRFQAALDASPWLDGAEICGDWSGAVVQTCGVSLEDFETPLSGRFTVRVVPPGSPNAQDAGAEVDLDPEADDPPDVLDGEVIDLGAYVLEHLALEIDPFPRKPGAVFEPPQTAEIISPFASLRDLKP
jgi:uncharacterized metal-binding protein YceD (DUF177 family)